MTDLPKEVVAGMQPILTKYGITDQTTQGRCMVSLGQMFQAINAKPVTRPKEVKKMAHKMMYQTSRILNQYGITDKIQQAKCAQEILEFVSELAKQLTEEMKK